MDDQLKLTARGYAVYELMADRGLSLDAACAHVEHELEILREKLEQLANDSANVDISSALEATLEGVSLRVQSAYLEELERAREANAYGAELNAAALH